MKRLWARLGTRLPSQYQYRPLDSSKREIRILIVHPASDPKDKIKCNLIHKRLDDAVDYCGLSYTWGNPNDRRPIWLDGVRFEVTVNLEEALRQLRQDDDDLVLWVDAICIDQSNLAERSSQVLMMRDIYASAMFVMAWIGPKDATSEKAFDLVEELANELENYQNPGQIVSEISSWIQDHTSPLFNDCSWMALADLLDRPWWSRAWIIQEVTLSKHTVIVCGDFALPWQYFALVCLSIFTYSASIMAAAVQGYDNVRNPHECQLAVERVQRLSEEAHTVRSLEFTGFARMTNQPPTKFYDIIRRHRWAHATDPRDKIYAFLGLATPAHTEVSSITVDYTIPIATLYRMFTRLQLETHKDIGILGDCSGTVRPPDFSSWTPAYQPTEEVGRMWLTEAEPYIVYRSATSVAPQFSFDEDGRKLLIKGVVFDIVERVGEIHDLRPGENLPNGQPYHPANVINSWAGIAGIQDAWALANDNSPENTDGDLDVARAGGLYPTGILNIEAFMRTYLFNPSHDLNADYFSPKFGFGLEPQFCAENLQPDGSNDVHLRARVGTVCGYSRFLVTKRGYFGVGRKETRVGDKICVLFGGKTPFVIREVGGCHELVGECYVQGIMSEEVVREVEGGRMEVNMIVLQ